MARKILLADDSVTAQNMGRKILSDAGYDVVTVNNGSAALKRVAEQKPDLIVLDVYMPGYSGLEVCQRLKDSPDTEGIPILLTVGKLEPFKPEEARRVKAEAYIVKPFEASELLSALTRLEDQMVPGHGKNGKSEGHGDTETGWKNRLRFPSKKKKEEPEPEADADFVGGSSFRDMRRGKAPTPVASAAVEKSESPAAAVPEIPRDITPEELDALSALAAKLDGDTPAADKSAPSEKAAPSEARKEFEVAAPAVDEKSAVIAAAQAESPVAPAEEMKPAAEAPAAEPAPATAEAKPPEAVPVRVETLADKEPAPVEKEDEPLFAAAPATAEAVAAEKVEVKPAEAAGVEVAPPVSATAPAEIEAKAEERKTDEPVAAEKLAAETAPEEPPKVEAAVPAPVAAATQAQEEQEAPAPSEEELAEALRLLTPSATESSPTPSQEPLAAAGAVLAREAARKATTTPQWMAVAVAVDPAEAALSLESEMFKTLAHPGRSAGASPSAVTTSAETAVPAVSSVEMSAPQQESKTEIEDATPAEEPAAVTFADAVRRDDEAVASAGAEAMGKDSGAEAGLPAAETMTVATSNAAAGGEEDMGKEGGKSGKSNWHQIRNAAPAAKDAVEAAKQAEAEAAPKAMAAAADGARVTAADPTAIANIVDSVLADLRPKIVEEISKKLAGK